MQDFEGKVAVVTGAASGIGRGMAGAFARAGMKVVLADIEKEPLAIAEQELSTAGADVLAVRTDVSRREDMDALRDRVLDRFGAVHILCNNAGVSGGGGGAIWESTANDWSWVLSVNLMGVVHGMQAFLPTMVEQDEEGHVVNTSSVLGLSSGAGSIYGVSKHAVTRLTEGLYYDLRGIDSKVGASVLCPGMIATRIIESERNRPAELRDELDGALREEITSRRAETQATFLENGMPPDEVGDIVFEAIKEDRFYILTHPAIKERVESRMRDILEDRSPSPPVQLAEGMMGSRRQ